MANPYEVEHNIKDSKPKGRTRRPSMSSFFNQLSQIETTTADTSTRTHNNIHATPTPSDVAAGERLLQEQMQFFLSNATDGTNEALLQSLISHLQTAIENPPEKVEGVPQSYLDSLERVPKKALKKTDECPICAEKFLDDEFPLVVELPCHKTHRFDLECVGPWLRLQGTCPLDRKDLSEKKKVPKKEEEDDEEEYDSLYA